jgi:hypothetical protein
MMYGQTQRMQLQSTSATGQSYIVSINGIPISANSASNITYWDNTILVNPTEFIYYPSNITYQPFINYTPSGIKCTICEEQATAYKTVDDKLYPLCNSKRCMKRLLMKLIADMV